ncbi:hypothetical protein JEQ12_016545 [Ovis aries]|uniref:Uncharacterized protein n=1 Tax=Ovis aries TaxID=9940 RepID=A0A836AF72_SHEEP|nr:hypothetical protein JEQ12_016545 [Ovis aries]
MASEDDLLSTQGKKTGTYVYREIRSSASGGIGFSSCGVRACLPHSTWDLPGPGIEPVSPAMAGRLAITGVPVKFYLSIKEFHMF